MTTPYLHTKIASISDEDILQLLRELETVTLVPLHDNSFLLHYLQQCLYPDGTRKAAPITKKAVQSLNPVNPVFLSKKVKNLSKSEIYAVCLEVVKLNHDGLELHEGKTLYSFINFFFKKKRIQTTNTWVY